MRRRAAISAFVVAWSIPGIAAAQEPPPQTPPAPAPEAESPEVRVIGSKPDSLQRIPGSGTVISPKEIERTQPYDTAEMLRRVPGLQVRQEEGGGFRLDIGVRGLDPGRARRVLVLEDGIPVAVNPYAESDLYYVPPMERMRGVEVVKGSGSILFGPQTTGGVVNFFTLTPPTHQVSAIEIWGGDRAYKKALAMYGDANGSFRYLVQAFHKEGDGFRGEPFASTDAFTKVAFDTSANGEATLKVGFHDDAAYSDDVGLTRQMYQDDPRRPTLAPHDHVKQRRYEASLVHEQRFSDWTKLKTLLYAYTTWRIWTRQDYTRAAQVGVDYDRIVGDTTLPLGALFFEKTDTIQERWYEVAGLEPRLETRFLTGDVGHTVDVGARFLTETSHYQQRAGDGYASEAGALVNEEMHRTYAVAGYVQDRIAFGEKLLVTPGFRAEHADFRRDITRVSTGPTTGVDTFTTGDSTSTGLIPGIGIIYGTRQAHVFGGMHVGWAPPRITDAVTAKGTPSQVDAEQGYNYELGTRVSAAKALRAEATGFYSLYTNQVVTAGGLDTTQLVNGGHTKHVGVEAALTLQLGSALKLPTTAIDLGARYTYVHATFEDPPYAGNLLPYSPQHTAGATLDVEDKVGVGGQIAWYHVGAQFTDQTDTKQEDVTGRIGEIPAYDVIDLAARYKHAPSGLTLKLLVKSALNDVYVAARRPEGIHQAGFREIMLGLRWDYEKGP